MGAIARPKNVGAGGAKNNTRRKSGRKRRAKGTRKVTVRTVVRGT